MEAPDDVDLARVHYAELGEAWRQEQSLVPVQLSKLKEETRCPICFGKIRDARVSMVCLHRYCARCIEQYIRAATMEGGVRKEEGGECPVCRARLGSRRSTKPDPLFDRMLQALYGDLDTFDREEETLIADASKGWQQDWQQQLAKMKQMREAQLAKQQAETRGRGRPAVLPRSASRSEGDEGGRMLPPLGGYGPVFGSTGGSSGGGLKRPGSSSGGGGRGGAWHPPLKRQRSLADVGGAGRAPLSLPFATPVPLADKRLLQFPEVRQLLSAAANCAAAAAAAGTRLPIKPEPAALGGPASAGAQPAGAVPGQGAALGRGGLLQARGPLGTPERKGSLQRQASRPRPGGSKGGGGPAGSSARASPADMRAEAQHLLLVSQAAAAAAARCPLADGMVTLQLQRAPEQGGLHGQPPLALSPFAISPARLPLGSLRRLLGRRLSMLLGAQLRGAGLLPQDQAGPQVEAALSLGGDWLEDEMTVAELAEAAGGDGVAGPCLSYTYQLAAPQAAAAADAAAHAAEAAADAGPGQHLTHAAGEPAAQAAAGEGGPAPAEAAPPQQEQPSAQLPAGQAAQEGGGV